MIRRMVQVQLLVGVCLIVMMGCAQEKVMIAKPFAPASLKTSQPVSRDTEAWWHQRHQDVLKRIKQGPVDLLLIGDSITQGWDYQKELWQKYFAPRHAVNLGFSGDRTEQVLWRLRHGEVNGIAPKAAMLMIGTNNNCINCSAEEIADGTVAICRELRARLPHTKILLLAIFPRGAKPDSIREKNARASMLASSIADGKMIFYMDINDKFLAPDGTLSKSIMPDLLHPNKQGDQIWADAVIPTIDELMK